MKPSREVIATLEAIATEIGAGQTFERSHDALVWNNAHDRCLSIVSSYRRGEGLFQITGKIKPSQEEPPTA